MWLGECVEGSVINNSIAALGTSQGRFELGYSLQNRFKSLRVNTPKFC